MTYYCWACEDTGCSQCEGLQPEAPKPDVWSKKVGGPPEIGDIVYDTQVGRKYTGKVEKLRPVTILWQDGQRSQPGEGEPYIIAPLHPRSDEVQQYTLSTDMTGWQVASDFRKGDANFVVVDKHGSMVASFHGPCSRENARAIVDLINSSNTPKTSAVLTSAKAVTGAGTYSPRSALLRNLTREILENEGVTLAARCDHKLMTGNPAFSYECNGWSGHEGEHRCVYEGRVIARWFE